MKNVIKLILAFGIVLGMLQLPQIGRAQIYGTYNQGFIKTSENGVPTSRNFQWPYSYQHQYYQYWQPYNYHPQYIYSNSYHPYWYGSPLQINCSAGMITQRYVEWHANVYGGRTPYTYYWRGTDNPANQNSSTIDVYYVTPGAKSVYVSVTSSDGQSAEAYCGNVYFSGYAYPYYYPY